MNVGNISVIDADSLDAAADLLESYGDYCARMADELHAEAVADGTITDDDDWTPPPAAPAALPLHCGLCDGVGIRRIYTGGRLSDWIEIACVRCGGTGEATPSCPACRGSGKEHTPGYEGRACWYCDGSGADHLAGEDTPLASIPFDHVAHCRRIASIGGNATVTIHGIHHMRMIGRTGARITIERHGFDCWCGITTAKGWTGHRAPDLLSDLRAGRELADLDRAA